MKNDNKEQADKLFNNYDFGDDIVETSNGWEFVNQLQTNSGYLVICLDDCEEGEEAEWVLLTRQVFPTKKDAQEYSKTVNQARTPIVVCCWSLSLYSIPKT